MRGGRAGVLLYGDRLLHHLLRLLHHTQRCDVTGALLLHGGGEKLGEEELETDFSRSRVAKPDETQRGVAGNLPARSATR